jgi:hypothetical protein
MTTFRQHMEQAVTGALAQFPATAAPDVYAITFRIDSVDQDPRFPYLAVGYHTETDVARTRAAPSPPDEWEARWSYAYFAPSGLEGIRIAGHDPERDPEGAQLYRRQAVTEGLWYEEADGLPEDQQDDHDERLDQQFHELCVELARHLHTSGRIVEALGRPVPVILYDMFDPDEMFALTKAANPAELVVEFLTGDPDATA